MKKRISKELLFCLTSAFFLILSFPDFNLWIFAWFGFVPLFIVLEGKSKLKAFLLSYLTGVIFWAGVIYWLANVTFPGTVILVLYLSLYFGLFGLIVSYSLPTTYSLLLLPSVWVLLEYARTYLLTGFPWALLGYSQYLNLPAIQIADITGVWGVSFLVMLVNATLYLVTSYKFPPQRLAGPPRIMAEQVTIKSRIILITFLIVFIVIGYGYYKLKPSPPDSYRSPLKVSVIQANIPQELKWDTRAKDFIIEEYFSLTKMAAQDKPDLIIWPEASSPAIIGEEPQYLQKLKDLVRSIKTPLVFGGIFSENSIYYNSAFLLSAKGELISRYDKLHLVPFGEYIPQKNIFGFLQTIVPIGEMAPGKEYTVFKLQTLNPKLQSDFAVLICFEDLFPELSKEFKKRGAALLINITNDAWYKKTSASHQHLQASVFRAVENRLFLARAANTGVSGFISPTGRIISLVRDSRGKDIFVKGYETETVACDTHPRTFYSRFSDIFIFICLIFSFCVIILALREKK